MADLTLHGERVTLRLLDGGRPAAAPRDPASAWCRRVVAGLRHGAAAGRHAGARHDVARGRTRRRVRRPGDAHRADGSLLQVGRHRHHARMTCVGQGLGSDTLRTPRATSSTTAAITGSRSIRRSPTSARSGRTKGSASSPSVSGASTRRAPTAHSTTICSWTCSPTSCGSARSRCRTIAADVLTPNRSTRP